MKKYPVELCTAIMPVFKKRKKTTLSPTIFRKKIYSYYRNHERALPWRETKNPYYILVSELMLQQTQASRVIEKYNLFIKTFPTVAHLARAPLSNVLSVWQGLGYNRRALYLCRAAIEIVKKHEGKIPKEQAVLKTLPGIGPYTAAAICAFAYDAPTVFIETNIRTVFIYFFFQNKKRVDDKEIFPLIEKMLDKKDPRRWYSALMDYGAALKAEGKSHGKKSLQYATQSRFTGSNRQRRGMIIRILLEHKKISIKKLAGELLIETEQLVQIIDSLESEGMIRVYGRGPTRGITLA